MQTEFSSDGQRWVRLTDVELRRLCRQFTADAYLLLECVRRGDTVKVGGAGFVRRAQTRAEREDAERQYELFCDS